jgi:hypothetical protein
VQEELTEMQKKCKQLEQENCHLKLSGVKTQRDLRAHAGEALSNVTNILAAHHKETEGET